MSSNELFETTRVIIDGKKNFNLIDYLFFIVFFFFLMNFVGRYTFTTSSLIFNGIQSDKITGNKNLEEVFR